MGRFHHYWLMLHCTDSKRLSAAPSQHGSQEAKGGSTGGPWSFGTPMTVRHEG